MQNGWAQNQSIEKCFYPHFLSLTQEHTLTNWELLRLRLSLMVILVHGSSLIGSFESTARPSSSSFFFTSSLTMRFGGGGGISVSDFVINVSPDSSLMLLLSLTITVWGSSSERKKAGLSYVRQTVDVPMYKCVNNWCINKQFKTSMIFSVKSVTCFIYYINKKIL